MANNTTNVLDSHPFCLIVPIDFDPYNPIRPGSVNPTWTVLATINAITALPTAGVNALIVWTVFSDEDLRLSPFNVLLGELAVTDMLVGLLVQPMYTVVLGCLVNNCYSPCHFTVYTLTAIACNGTTFVTLALACAERFLSIEHPNLYNRIVTGNRVQKVAVISWTLTLVYLVTLTIFLNITNPDITKVPSVLLAVICAVVIMFCCTKVQLTAYRQQRSINIQQQAPSVLQQNEAQEQASRLKELKKVFTMTVLVIMSAIFLVPYIITTGAQFATNQGPEFNYLVSPVSFTVLFLQSLFNPAILSLRLSYIRNGIKSKINFLISLLGFGN